MTAIEKNNKRACILNYPVDMITKDDAVSLLSRHIESSVGAHVVTINPEMIAQGDKNPEFKGILTNADLIVPDGVGIIYALKSLGINNVGQLPGIELSEALIAKCAEKGYSISMLGATRDVIYAAVVELKAKYPSLNIVYSRDGFFKEDDEAEIIDKLAEIKTQVLFVALGVPKQELWIAKYRNTLNSTVMVGVGGSFDVWAKKVKRAPYLFRKLGMEWLFRLICQPSRFNRMFPVLPLFLIRVLTEKSKSRKEY